MSLQKRYSATVEDDRDRLQELKGTLDHWMVMTRQYAEETRDPYAFVQYMNLEHLLRCAQDSVERTLGVVMEERSANLAERLSRLHTDLCERATVFGSPC
jgi:hypothetical protein